MVLDYSRHARDRMAERGITEAEVEVTLNRPVGRPEAGTSPGTIKVTGATQGDEGALQIVVTADGQFVVTLWRK